MLGIRFGLSCKRTVVVHIWDKAGKYCDRNNMGSRVSGQLCMIRVYFGLQRNGQGVSKSQTVLKQN